MRRAHAAFLCAFLILTCIEPAQNQEDKTKRFLCTAIPIEKDSSCPVQAEYVQKLQDEELKKTVVQLRETVQQQQETIVHQLGSITELTSKLSQCESVSDQSAATWRDTMDDVPRDPYESLDALGKTMQSLKGRLQNLEQQQVRANLSGAPFPKELRDLLQRRLGDLENQLLKKVDELEEEKSQLYNETSAHRERTENTLNALTNRISDLERAGTVGFKTPEDFKLSLPLRTNYLFGRVKKSLPEMYVFTVCMWLKSSASLGIGTPFSYGVPGQANEIVLIEWGNNPIELLINDKVAQLPLSLNDGRWHHICITWTTRDGMWEAYQDGQRLGSGENLAPWHPIKPDGILILGQEQNVMEQFNPGLRNLVNLGKNYQKSVMAMTAAGKAYFDAVSKIGENAAVSPVSRELGVVLMEISEVHKRVQLELEESLKRFHREIIAELEKKTEMDVKYMTATFKRYQSEHKMRQDSLDRSHADLKKLRRKSQGKHSSKYDIKENEYVQTISSRQNDMQKFIADGCTEALLEEKRRFCFLVDKHCTLSYEMAGFHEKAKEMLSVKLLSWQDKCTDATKVPDTILSMIEGLRTPEPSPHMERYDRNSDFVVPPPAPPLKAQTSPLVNMFSQDVPASSGSPEPYSDQDSLDGGGSMSRSTSASSGMNLIKKPRVQTIFPHTAGNNETLLSFDDGEIITLLIQEEKDGWLYGELDKTGQRGWFPSSYCRPFSEPVISDMAAETPLHRLNMAKQSREEEEDEEHPVFLPPPDYTDSSRKPSAPSSQTTQVSLSNGTSMPPFLGGGNPFATVKLRPTITNDRSAPNI